MNHHCAVSIKMGIVRTLANDQTDCSLQKQLAQWARRPFAEILIQLDFSTALMLG